MKKMVHNQKGQSAIEFLITFVFAVGLIFLFIRLAINFGTGYLVHYATFMSSRVLMSYDNGNGSANTVINSAKREASTEFKKYKVDLLGLNSNKLEFNLPLSGKLYEYVGTHFKYKKPFSFVKVFGGDTQVEYLSESFLGKEVPRTECFKRTCWAMNGSADECNPAGQHFTLFDNGC
jgi:hypothetical protein